jgi:hypothetical protein
MNRQYLTWCTVGLGAAFFWGIHQINLGQGERFDRLERKIEATTRTIRLLNQDPPAEVPRPKVVGPAEATIIADDPPAAKPTEPNPVPGAKSALPIEASAAGLRLLLQRHPQWNIPEIDLLTSGDFVLFAADLLPESMLDEEGQRQVLRDLRSLAKRRFAAEFQTAIEGYLTDHAWILPRDSGELGPYFSWRVPPAILHRYEVFQIENRVGMILERAPVDPDYETHPAIRYCGCSKRSLPQPRCFCVAAQPSSRRMRAESPWLRSNCSRISRNPSIRATYRNGSPNGNLPDGRKPRSR